MRIALAVAALLTFTACERGPELDPSPLPADPIELRDVGFSAPESVLHDSVADVYLVSNINGRGRDRDDNGFISRVSPDGELLELKWIDGASAAVRLSAPKGTAIIGDSLFIADIDSIRVFHRVTGVPLRAFTVQNATAWNDLAVTADGALWVSDMGDGTPDTSARTGLHRVAPDGSSTMVMTGEELEGPNGLAPIGSDVAVAAYRGTVIRRVGERDKGATIVELDASGLDGIVRLPDGGLLVSSWDATAIFRVAPDASTSVLLDDLRSPADIGYDARRHRLLIPSFEGGWLRIVPLE